jgi:hypothetical protein
MAYRKHVPTARKGEGYFGDGIVNVDYMGREYTVCSIGTAYVQVLLHAERKAPAGSSYPSGKARTTDGYVRHVDPKGPLGRMLVAAAKEIA